MSSLSPAQLLKYDWRVQKFLEKYKNNEKFELNSGSFVNLAFEQQKYDILARKNNSEYQKLEFTDARVKTRKYKLSSFKKTVEFGGKPPGGGAGVGIEMREINSINEQLYEIMGTTGKKSVEVIIKNKKFYIAKCIKTGPGDPKSDFSLLDESGTAVAFISHKEGSTARDFQQWGGMTQAEIQGHPESQMFIKQMQEKYPDGIPNATTVAKKIKDERLKHMSVYGVAFNPTGTYNIENVSLVLQGPIKLRRYGSGYKFHANHEHENGERITGDFEPVFMAIYKGDRSNFGVKGARFAIQPRGSRKVKEWIED